MISIASYSKHANKIKIVCVLGLKLIIVCLPPVQCGMEEVPTVASHSCADNWTKVSAPKTP